MWHGEAEYADGTYIEKDFPYMANGSYTKENEEQYACEEWLIEAHEGCVWYSVVYVEE